MQIPNKMNIKKSDKRHFFEGTMSVPVQGLTHIK